MRSFVVNLLAGVITLALGVFVVDRYLKLQERRRWIKTQALTTRAIAVHLCEITGALFQYYADVPGVPFFAAHQKALDPTILEAFDPLLAALNESTQATEKGLSPSDVAIRYYDALEWDFAEIANVLTPRLLESPATSQRLRDRLMEFDDARRKFRHAIIAHQQAVTQSVFPYAVVPLIEAAKRLYAELLKV